MKIIFAAYHNPKFKTVTEYAEEALVELGHECYPFDDRTFFFPGRLRDRFSFLQDWDLNRLNAKLVKKAIEVKADLCIVAGGHRILLETIENLKESNIKTVLWTMDPPTNFKPIEKSAPYYDYVFCAGSEAIEILKPLSLNSLNWLPFACSGVEHHEVDLSVQEKEEYQSAICFIGSYYPNREKIFEQIYDLDFTIWGPGWENVSEKSHLKRCIRKTGTITSKEWLKILSAAKSAIVVHYQDGKVLCDQASPKLYEAMACAKVVFCDSQKDAMELFEDGQEVVFYSDASDLREKIKIYLSSVEKSAEISTKAEELVREKHTYLNRMEELLSVITEE